MKYRTRSQYGKSISWHISRTKLLQENDRSMTRVYGEHKWTENRIGARWTQEENNVLLEFVRQHTVTPIRTSPHLLPGDIAKVAWMHGRTSLAVEAQLKKLLTYPVYMKLIGEL